MRTGKMKDITQFDAEFFGYSPALAERSDPQQRMLLEVVYEAIVDAGWISFYIIQYFLFFETLTILNIFKRLKYKKLYYAELR